MKTRQRTSKTLELLNLKQVAKLLGVSPRALDRPAMRTAILNRIKVVDEGQYRYSRYLLEKLMTGEPMVKRGR